MGRLTIDEVIAHCKRHTEIMEKVATRHFFETEKLESDTVKQYWEHRQVADWLQELKARYARDKPKKVVYRKQSYGTPWFCPNCEADQVKVEFFKSDGSEPVGKYSYCWCCGQKIDWSEADHVEA